MPDYGLLSTGFVAKPQGVIQQEMEQHLLDKVSPNLDLSPESYFGEQITAGSLQIRQLWEAAQASDAGRDPRQAEGEALDAIGEYTATTREPARASVAYMTIELTAAGGSGGTYAAGLLKVNVLNDGSKVFANRSSITVGVDSTLVDVPFDCLQVGPIQAAAGSLSVITTPVTGFSLPEVDFQPLAASLGAYAESDGSYRARRYRAARRPGAANADAVRAEIEENAEVTFCRVYENDTDATVDGIPAHSYWVVVEGGADTDIGLAILNSKTGGISTKGDEVVTVTSASGAGHVIRFDRPTEVACDASITCTYYAGSYASPTAAATAIKAAWVAASEELQNVGRDVVIIQYAAKLVALGTIDTATILVAKHSLTPAASNITIQPHERATFVVGNVSVTATAVSGPA